MQVKKRVWVVLGLVVGLGAPEAVRAQADAAPWADSGVVSINQQPPRSALDPMGPSEDPDRWRLSLNREWRFLWLDRVANAPPDLNASLQSDQSWSTIRVPSNWQEQGFGSAVLARHAEQNPVYSPGLSVPGGVFVRDFTLPAAWSGRQTMLRLRRTRASVSVGVNGNQVGYSENTEAGAEFNLTRHLRDGVNRLTLLVTGWSTSTEHNGTHWTYGGLLDDVELISVPPVFVRDFAAEALWDSESGGGTLDLRFWLRSFLPRPSGGYRIETDLLAPDGTAVTRRFRRGIALGASRETEATLRLQIGTGVEPWSANSPSLYTLRVRLLDSQGRLLQRSRTRVGFRSLEFGNQGMTINGRGETLRGMSLDADLPVKVTGRSAIERHLRLLKKAGVNALRLSTPLGREWYPLLDEYGFYTFHELRTPLAAAGGARGFERATATVEMTKNHPSTLAWAWADEPRDGTADLGAWLRKHGIGRPVLPNARVSLVAKPRSWTLARRARAADRLLILWPFGSLLGNSGGELANLWQVVDTHPAVIGGFLPHWMMATGPDPIDAVARGVLDGEGEPLPAYAEVVDLYRQVRFRALDPAAAGFRLVNKSSREITEPEGRWTLRRDGSVVAAGLLPRLAVLPGVNVDFHIAGLPPRNQPAEYHLTLELRSRQPLPGRPAGTILARDQFALPGPDPGMGPVSGEMPALAVDESAASVRLGTREVVVDLDGATGMPRYLALRGRALIEGVVRPSLWRMPTQLERANGLAELDDRLRTVFDGAPAEWVGRRVSAGSYSAVGEFTVLDEGLMRLQTTAYGTGAMELGLHWLGEPGIPDPPRLGISIPLGASVSSVEWFGRGPGESYRNRSSGTQIGRWEADAEFVNPYVWVQAHGERTQVRWLTLWYSDGAGLMVVGPRTFSFSLERNAGQPILELNALHRGVGAERDDALLDRSARIAPGNYRATFLLLPVESDTNPADLYRRSAPTREIAARLQTPIELSAWRLAHLAREQPLDLTESGPDAPPTRRSPLNDGWIGSIDAFDGSWQPINSPPAEITIDLERVEPVRRLRLGLLAHPAACATIPAGVEFSYSTDRRRWVSLEPLPPAATAGQDHRRLWLTRDLLGRPVRWVRVRIPDPESECRPGKRHRVLVDELVVE